MTGVVRLLPSPTSSGTIRRRRDDDRASSVSLFFRLSLCLRSGMSIAGNNVPPVPDDIESMGGTNSEFPAPHPPRPGHPLPRGEGNSNATPSRSPFARGSNELGRQFRRLEVIFPGQAEVGPITVDVRKDEGHDSLRNLKNVSNLAKRPRQMRRGLSLYKGVQNRYDLIRGPELPCVSRQVSSSGEPAFWPPRALKPAAISGEGPRL
jgi:hypothetical protein